MLEKLKQSWQRFKAGLPGRRFEQQFRFWRQFRSSPLRKALFIAGGILVLAAGLFLLFAPGPGIILLLLGAVLIAQQSSLAARAFDRIEMHLRKLLRRSLDMWRHSSPALKILLVFLAVALVGAVGLGAYQFLLKPKTS